MSERVQERLKVRGHVVLVFTNPETGFKQTVETHNLVTNDGDLHYAERLTDSFQGSVTFTEFTAPRMETYNGGPSPPTKTSDRGDMTTLVGSEKAPSAGYPLNDDADTDNTGRGPDILSWKFEYGTSESNGTITHVIITNASPGASEPCLTVAELSSSRVKTSSDTLTVYVNHEILGS